MGGRWRMEKSLVDGALRILKENFGASAGERVLVLVDEPEGRSVLSVAGAFLKAANLLGLEAEKVVYPSVGGHGKEPPESVWARVWGDECVSRLKEEGLWEQIVGKRVGSWERLIPLFEPYRDRIPQIVVALPYYSTSHTFFRKLLTGFGARYASMPLFEEEMLTGSASVSCFELRPVTERIARLLSEADEVRVRTKGTDLTLSVAGREGIADTGCLMEPGSFSNLPAGEAFIAPVEGTARGVLTVEWAPTRRLSSPIRVFIEKGRAVGVEGEDPYADFLKDVFEKVENASNVAELGIGTNPRARRPDNILEAEKILGTIHIAFGDNSTFGGCTRANFHQDHVVFSPTVEFRVGGRWLRIMQSGKLTI